MAAISEYPEKWTMNQLGGTGLAISAYEQGLKFAYTATALAAAHTFRAKLDTPVEYA